MEPAAIPSAEITPARRPCVRLRVETYSMSGPGARFSASVAVMNKASEARSIMGAAAELHERIAAHAMHRPLIHRHRAETLVELDRAHVPVEHRPLQPPAAALQCEAREMPQQGFAAALAAKLLP